MRQKRFHSLAIAVFLWFGAGFYGCSSSSVPPDDASSLCSSDSECLPGQYCNNGVCQASSILCEEGGSCPDGYTCRNGGCVPSGEDGGDGGDGGEQQEPDEVVSEPDIQIDDPPLVGDPPQYQLDFGNVMVGVTVESSIRVSNVGNAELRILELSFESGQGEQDFSIAPEVLNSLPIVLQPSEQATIEVRYTASDGISDHAVLDIISNDPDEALVKVHLVSEFKGDARIVAQPESLSFGDVPVGQASQPLVVNFTNQGTGNAVLTIQDVRTGILANPDFSLQVRDSGGSEVTLPAFLNNGDFIQVYVTYHPQRAEDDSDEVVVVSDDALTPNLSVPISGRGVVGDLSVQPSPVDVGKVRVGEHGEVTVTLSNSGGAPFDLTGVTLADASSEFTLTSTDLDLPNLSTAPHTLAPAESVTISIGFDPQDIGQETAALIIDNTTETPQRNVAVSAEGFIPPSVETEPDPPSLLFGNVQLDSGSGAVEEKAIDVVIRNVGGEPLSISSI
ncbi:MAG: choice-of-anchor D domain-containing protein, partial [Deltaproteobacteria bacterium]